MDNENSDFAALSASALAAILAIYTAAGPYDIFGLAISATLLMVAISYAGGRPRNSLKSLAFAGVIGLILVPAAGYAIESILAEKNCDPLGGCYPSDASAVESYMVFAAWLIFSLAAFICDKYAQTKITPPPRTGPQAAR